jgi:hypothetical protein
MIHGDSVSLGCLAIGDEAIEDLFVLAADAGWDDAIVMLSPVDFRKGGLPGDYHPPTAWTEALYSSLCTKINALPTRVVQ